jgi:hypothetical protein
VRILHRKRFGVQYSPSCPRCAPSIATVWNIDVDSPSKKFFGWVGRLFYNALVLKNVMSNRLLAG